MELKAAVISVLGGVGACSPERYAIALKEIAAMCNREVTDTFVWEVRQILKALPCSLD